MKGITTAAKQANGKSRACATCPIKRNRGYVCPKYNGFAPMRL